MLPDRASSAPILTKFLDRYPVQQQLPLTSVSARKLTNRPLNRSRSSAITATQVSLGSATLSWTAPTQNNDGSSLIDLSGFKIYYGTEQGSYPTSVRIENPDICTYVVENLTPDTYYFVSTAINSGGIESSYSNEAIKVVN